MRLPWQCPTCYAELGDKSHAGMLTCPYCGTLLIVDRAHSKFLRVPRDRGWYYFSRTNSPGCIKFGNREEHYRYREGTWYMLREDTIYEMQGKARAQDLPVQEEGKVTYIWGEIPFVAPPGSVIRTAMRNGELYRMVSGAVYLFLKSQKEVTDIFSELLKC